MVKYPDVSLCYCPVSMLWLCFWYVPHKYIKHTHLHQTIVTKNHKWSLLMLKYYLCPPTLCLCLTLSRTSVIPEAKKKEFKNKPTEFKCLLAKPRFFFHSFLIMAHCSFCRMLNKNLNYLFVCHSFLTVFIPGNECTICI